MNASIKKRLYRNGQLQERFTLRNGRRHGLARTWHKNGQLASEETFQNDLIHGICRQWNESGHLLGQYTMVQGTGIQRAWHDNGRLQMEVSTARGKFCGRNRIWLRDGTLLSERFYLHGEIVSAKTYRAAAAKDKSLPKFRGKPAKLPPKNQATEKYILKVFVDSLLEKPNHSEARKWLAKKSGDKTVRLMGRFKSEQIAAKFVEALYTVGAVEVIVPDIYRSKARDRYSDCLLVQLPRSAAKRKTIRKVCAQLRTRKLGAVQPDLDVGEGHLYLSLF